MAVHASSVIATSINTFDSAFYTAITNLEEYVYDSGTNGQLTETQDSFQNLSDAIIAWMAIDREEDILDLIFGLYGYKMMVDLHAIDNSLLATSDGRSVFSIDGFRTRIKTDITAYYDDYPQVTFDSAGLTITRTSGSWIVDGFTDTMGITVSGSSSNDGGFTISGAPTALVLTLSSAPSDEGPSGFIKITGSGSVIMTGANLSTDIGLTTNAHVDQEDVDIPVLITGYQERVGGKTHDLLFIDTPPPGTALTKLQMAQYIFTTLYYEEIYENLEVGSLSVPPLV